MYLLKHFNSSCDLASPGTAYKSFCSNSFLNPNQNKGSTQLKKLYTSNFIIQAPKNYSISNTCHYITVETVNVDNKTRCNLKHQHKMKTSLLATNTAVIIALLL